MKIDRDMSRIQRAGKPSAFQVIAFILAMLLIAIAK